MAIKGIDAIKAALDKYKGAGKTQFFSLENDGDTAKVRFMNGGDDDLGIFVVHEVEINGKKRYVECTQEENCPLCMAGNFAQVKMFLHLIDRRDGQVKMWERGRTFIPEILGFVQRYGSLNNRDYEIVRHGVKKDPKTKFQLFPLDKKVERNMPDRPEICGEKEFILQKSVEDMRKIADGTYTPPTSGGTSGNNQQADSGEDVF